MGNAIGTPYIPSGGLTAPLAETLTIPKSNVLINSGIPIIAANASSSGDDTCNYNRAFYTHTFSTVTYPRGLIISVPKFTAGYKYQNTSYQCTVYANTYMCLTVIMRSCIGATNNTYDHMQRMHATSYKYAADTVMPGSGSLSFTFPACSFAVPASFNTIYLLASLNKSYSGNGGNVYFVPSAAIPLTVYKITL